MTTHTPHDGRVSLRLPRDTLDRLEALRDHLAARDPQLLQLYHASLPTVSAVTRLAIEIGVQHLEKAAKTRTPNPPSRG